VLIGKPNWFFLLTFIVIMAGLLGGCDLESQSVDEAKYTKKVRGEINSVKPDARKLVLNPSSEEQGEGVIHFKLAQDATVTVLGKEAQLADLKADQQAEIAYFVQEDSTNRAGSVKVTEQPPVIKTAGGEIKRIVPDRRKIILKPSSEEQGEGVIHFRLEEDATVTVLGKEAQLADLKAGQQAEIQYLVQEGPTQKAHSVKVTEQPPVVKTATGEIKKLKPDRRKIILRQDETVMIFKVTENATITLNGQDAELADLEAGQQVEIQYFVQDGINRANSVKSGETAAVSGRTPG
jgi:Cu/Ag efflux protein CusF